MAMIGVVYTEILHRESTENMKKTEYWASDQGAIALSHGATPSLFPPTAHSHIQRRRPKHDNFEKIEVELFEGLLGIAFRGDALGAF